MSIINHSGKKKKKEKQQTYFLFLKSRYLDVNSNALSLQGGLT